MNKVIKFALSLLIGLVIFLIVMLKVGLENIEQAFLLFFNIEGLTVVAITVLFVLIGILRWKLILKWHGNEFSFKTLTPLWLIGFCMSFLTPFSVFGGEVFRIYFTKKKLSKISIERAVSSVCIDKLLDSIVFFIFLLAGLFTFFYFGHMPKNTAFLSFLLLPFIFLLLLLFFFFKRWRKQSLVEWAVKHLKFNKFFGGKGEEVMRVAEEEIFKFFSFKNERFFIGIFLSFLRYGVLLFRTLVLIAFLTGSFGFFKALASYAFTNLAGLMPLPAFLGALEVGQGFVFKVFGFGFGKGTVFSMIWRGADLLVCLFGIFFIIKYTVWIAQEKVFKFFER